MKFLKKEKLNKESGATAILTTVLIMSAVLSLALLLTGAVIKNLNLSFDFTESIRAFYAADGAIEKCVYEARKAAGDCMNVDGTASLVLGNGASGQATRESATIIESLGSFGSANRKIRAEGDFAAVVVSEINPVAAVVDSTVSAITVIGSGFEDGAIVKLRQGETEIIPSTPFSFDDENTLSGGSFNFAGAELGSWSVIVQNPDGQAGALTNGFTVTDLPPPSVSSISPSSGSVDTTVSGVSISGANFLSGATARLESGVEVINPTTAFNFVSSILLNGGSFDLTGAQTGNWDVFVYNPSGEPGSLKNGFSINTVPSGWSGPYVLKSGNNNCPGSYPSKSLYYTGCSSASCSASGGGYWLYEHLNCGGWSYFYNSTGCDNGIYNAGHNDQVTSSRAQGCSCSSSGGSPQGQITVCCQ